MVRVIGEREFSIELGDRKVAQRVQLPLKLVRSWRCVHLGVGNLHPQVAGHDAGPPRRRSPRGFRGGNDLRRALPGRFRRQDETPKLRAPRGSRQSKVGMPRGFPLESSSSIEAPSSRSRSPWESEPSLIHSLPRGESLSRGNRKNPRRERRRTPRRFRGRFCRVARLCGNPSLPRESVTAGKTWIWRGGKRCIRSRLPSKSWKNRGTESTKKCCARRRRRRTARNRSSPRGTCRTRWCSSE